MSKIIEIQNRALLQLEQRLRALEQTGPVAQPAQPVQPAQPAPPGAIARPAPQPAPPPTEAPITIPERPPVAEVMPEPQLTPVEPPPVPPLGPVARPAEPVQPAPVAPAPEEPATAGVAEEPAKREAETKRSLEVVAGEAQGFFGQRFTIEPAVTYSRVERNQIILNGFLALDAIFLGNISVDEVRSDIVTADITGRVGIGDDTQFDVNVPYVFRQTEFISGGAGGGSTNRISRTVSTDSIGDVSAGINYRIINETESIPDVVVNVRGRAPTGKHPFGIELEEVPGSEGNLTVPEDLPTGNGVWQVSGGFSLLKTLDPALLFTSFDYFHNFERDFNDIGAEPGNQPGKVRLGDSFQIGLGAAYALNERLSLSLSYTHRFFEKSRVKPDGGNTERVTGSDANVARLNTGVTFAITDRLTLVSNIAAGLTDDAPDVEVRVGLPFNF